MKYIVKRNGVWLMESRTKPPQEEHYVAECPHISCYEIIDDIPFLSENKNADMENRIAKRDYELRKQK